MRTRTFTALLDQAAERDVATSEQNGREPEETMSDDNIMCIVNAPRIEIVLVPENQAQREGDEVEDDTLLDAYLIMHLPDGTNVNLKLDGGPFDVEAGTNLLAAVATTVGEKYAPPEARGAEPSVTFDAKLRKH
jgi:hypothetical protein